MSKIQVNDIVNHYDTGAPQFPKGIAVGSGATLGLNVGTGASIYSPSDNVLTLGTNNTEKVRITSTGLVGIGTDNPSEKLSIENGNIFIRGVSGTESYIYFTNSSTANRRSYVGAVEGTGNSNSLVFATNADGGDGEERLRITSGGNVLIGAQASVRMGKSSLAQVVQVSANDNSSGLGMRRASDTAFGSYLAFAKANGTLAAPTAVVDGDEIGHISWGAYDGNDYRSYCAHISAEIQGTPGSNDTPGKLVFGTTSPGSSTSTARMSIDSTGAIVLPNDSPGIQFGTSGAAGLTSKTLDDYEEGTWTPTLSFGGNSTSITYSARAGSYTRVGNVVFLQLAMNVSNTGSSTGDLLISLPFAVNNSTDWSQWESIGSHFVLTGSSAWSTAVPTFSDVKGGIIFATAQADSVLLEKTDVSTAFNLRVTGSYIAA